MLGILLRILLISFFLLFPSVVFSGIGDVYYCQSNKNVDIKNGKITTFKDERFKFRRISEGLIFGSDKGYLQNIRLTSKNYDMGSELFSYKDDLSGTSSIIFKYENGNFNMSHVSYSKITSMTGICSIF